MGDMQLLRLSILLRYLANRTIFLFEKYAKYWIFLMIFAFILKFYVIGLLLLLFLLTSFLIDFLYYKINDYLSVNRFTGTLNMRSDTDVKKLNQYRRAVRMPRDEFLSLMFLSGIREIKKIPKYKVPFKYYRKYMNVSTNETIYRHLPSGTGNNHQVLEAKQKVIKEKIMLLSFKEILLLTFTKKKKKLLDQLLEKNEYYKIRIYV